MCAVLVALMTISMLPTVSVLGNYSPGATQVGFGLEVTREGNQLHVDLFSVGGSSIVGLLTFTGQISFPMDRVAHVSETIQPGWNAANESFVDTSTGDVWIWVNPTSFATGAPLGNILRNTFNIIGSTDTPIVFTLDVDDDSYFCPTTGSGTTRYPSEVRTASYGGAADVPSIIVTGDGNFPSITVGQSIPGARNFTIQNGPVALTNVNHNAPANWTFTGFPIANLEAGGTATVTARPNVPNTAVTTLNSPWIISGTGAGQTVSDTVNLSFAITAAPPTLTALTATNSSAAVPSGGTGGTPITLTFTATGTNLAANNFTASGPAWATVGNPTLSGNTVSVVVTAGANNTGSPRTASVTLNNNVNASLAPTVSLTQAPHSIPTGDLIFEFDQDTVQPESLANLQIRIRNNPGFESLSIRLGIPQDWGIGLVTAGPSTGLSPVGDGGANSGGFITEVNPATNELFIMVSGLPANNMTGSGTEEVLLYNIALQAPPLEEGAPPVRSEGILAAFYNHLNRDEPTSFGGDLIDFNFTYLPSTDPDTGELLTGVTVIIAHDAPETYIIGDVNTSGHLTSRDASLIARYVIDRQGRGDAAPLNFGGNADVEFNYRAANVDCLFPTGSYADGRSTTDVGIALATRLARYLVGSRDSLCDTAPGQCPNHNCPNNGVE